VVTGISGFVGSALARRLTGSGVAVLGLVRPGSTAPRIAGLPGVKLVAWDGSAEALRMTFAEFRPTVVYHLASYGVRPGATDPGETVRGNVDLALSGRILFRDCCV
jgi:dihydroflavonol-4-reductase